ncbi:helix-turn-helix domain-containing protein, partial [Salmonella enterica subsp. enterica serovar Typhimurium]|nr:helix-turn-helix domain-containing protein [Salmonella enterica subsp. enterica serovar Typhimurium]
MASHSVTEAAKLAGVTRRTIYRHIKAGKLSASVTGGDNTVIETSELLRVYGVLSQPEPEKV